MKEKNLYIILIPTCIILCAILAIISYLKIVNNNNDSIKFKNEYERFNGEKSSSGKEYKKLNIDRNNPIKYSNYDEIIDVIENKSGVIYLGFPECPWCRTALPVLFDVLKENNIDNLYYLNIKNERDSYVVQDDKITYELDDNDREIKGTKGYFRLLDVLDRYLTEYIISYEGKTYETGEKRLYAPSVIFVKDGKVLGIQVSTVETQEDGYDELTKDQYDELYGIYESYIVEMNSDTCSLDSSC